MIIVPSVTMQTSVGSARPLTCMTDREGAPPASTQLSTTTGDANLVPKTAQIVTIPRVVNNATSLTSSPETPPTTERVIASTADKAHISTRIGNSA